LRTFQLNLMRGLLFPSRYAFCWALTSVAVTVAVSAQTLTLERSAVTGALASIAEERTWDRSTCEPQRTFVSVVGQPTNGTVTIHEEELRIPTTVRGDPTGPCAGRPITGQHLYYQSKPGFVGSDRIVYATSHDGDPPRQTVVNVAVTSQPMPLPPNQAPRPVSYRTVTSGLATDIGSVTRWGVSCEPLPPTLILVENPQHGTTIIRDEPAAIPGRDSEGNPVPCVGRTTVRKALYYQSQAGFQGMDHVVYDTEHGRYRVEITVSGGSPR